MFGIFTRKALGHMVRFKVTVTDGHGTDGRTRSQDLYMSLAGRDIKSRVTEPKIMQLFIISKISSINLSGFFRTRCMNR